MRTSQIYIEGKRLDLFQDEVIKVNSSIQNIFEIDGIRTDLTQSFTVPASENNNQIFNHFYNSDVDTFNGVTLDYNVRRKAHIEIDLTPFKTGKIQLEKANIKDNNPESYTIAFYGDLMTLKDILGVDKLNTLNLNAYSHDYNESAVINRVVEDEDFNVRYPLISSKRVWEYNGSTPANNINVNAGAINVIELFPALKNSRIIEAIEDKYNINFDFLFKQDKRFDNSFLYLKNKDEFSFRTPTQEIFYADVDNTTYLDYSTSAVLLFYRTDKFTDLYQNTGTHNVRISITPSNTTQEYFIDVFSNGTLLNTITGVGVATYQVLTIQNVSGLQQNITFKIRASVTMNIFASIKYEYFYFEYDIGAAQYFWTSEVYTATTATFTLNGNVDLIGNAPDITIYDYLNGLIKEFNFVIFGTDENTFKIQTLEDWYADGFTYDITAFTDVNSIDIERVKIYKRISFEHEKSESFMNRIFFDNNTREYGSLDYTFSANGEDLNIKIPFENILFHNLNNTGIQVGYCLTKAPDFKPYIPKPTILYLYDQQTVDSFKFEYGGGHLTRDYYMPMGQDLIYNGQNYSLNFGNDISSLLNVNIPLSNFMVYYYTYLNNLYQQKNRISYVKTRLPNWILTNLKLNDRLIIRDHRYIINSMATDLSSNEVDLVLLNDFRPIDIKSKPPIVKVPIIKVPISFPNNVINVLIDFTNPDIVVDGVKSVDTPVLVNSEKIITIDTTDVTADIVDLQFTYNEVNNTTDTTILSIYKI